MSQERRDEVETQKRIVQALKDKKRALEDTRSRATSDSEKSQASKEIEGVDREIYDADKRVDQAVAALEARKRHIEDASYNIQRCIDHRTAVMNTFAAARDSMQSENDEAIKPIARELRDRIEATKSGHTESIKQRMVSLQVCRDSRF